MTMSLRPLAGTARQLYDALVPWINATADPEPLIVRTSGTSGHPKDVILARRALLASADATHERLGGPGQWLLALPPLGVAGLQVLIRSIRADHAPVFVDDFDSLGQAHESMSANRSYVSLVPTQLHRLARAGTLDQLRGFDAVLLGGAAAPADLLDDAKAAGVHVVRTYGMSETSGGCVYDGLPLEEVQLRIGAEGRVHLGGPTLFDGYSGEPEATAAVLSGGWFASADIGAIDEAGLLHITGRVDDVVISGGVNVALPVVTQTIRDSAGVDDAFAVGIDDHEWGQRVVACIVGTADLAAVRDAVEAGGLPRSHAPRQLVRLDALPLLTGGKVDRLALQALAREQTT